MKTAPDFTESDSKPKRKRKKCAPCAGKGCDACSGQGWAFAPFYGPGDGTSQAAISTAAPSSAAPVQAVMASKDLSGQSIFAEVQFLANLGREKS